MRSGTTMTLEELRASAEAGDHQALIELARQLDMANRPIDTIEVLSRAANRGNVQARFMVAVRLLIGYHVPVRAEDAIGLLMDCVNQGHRDAPALLATVFAIGAYVSQDFARALNFLVTAAERGSTHAQQQLRILSGIGEAPYLSERADHSDLWKRLRTGIDPASWSRPAEVESLCDAPRIGRVGELVSDAACDWMVIRSRQRLVRAEVYNSAQQTTQVSETRTNTTAVFNLIDSDLVTTYIQMRMAAAVGMPFDHMEASAVLHYDPGEQITDHFDFIDPRSANYQEQLAKQGQRAATFLLYLNDDYEGGETEFRHLKIRHKGRKREGLFFHNIDVAGEPDMRTVHAGLPPLNGPKWIVSQFIRSRPATPGNGT